MDAEGEMTIQGKGMLHATFEDKGHIRGFLGRRPGAEVISFEVDRSIVDQVCSSAVRQAQGRAFPGMPQIDDPPKTANAFGLPGIWHDKLRQAAVAGSGRIGGLGVINNQSSLVTGAAVGGTHYE